MIRSHFIAFVLASAVPSVANAQNLPARDIADQAQTLKATQVPPVEPPASPEAADAAKPPSSGKADLVVAPIPVSNPATGTGLAGAAVLFYNPNKASQPWVSGIGGGYTSSDTWALGAFHTMSLAHDRARIMAFAGYGDAHLKFYGIGPDAGEAGVHVDINDEAFYGMVDAEVRIFNKGFLRHLYVGAKLTYLDIKTTLDFPPPVSRPDLDPPALERKSTLAMIGPAFTFDSRNNSTNPSKGVYVTGSLLYGASWLDSDFTNHKLEFGANAYFPLGHKGTVLAIRKQLCGASDDSPYYGVCLFGAQGDLRGYETGRYRDGASWALQAELRQHVAGRFGAVAFAGAGGIAEDTKAIWKHSTVLYSGGVGLRYLASRSSNVNLRADIAWGKDGAMFYFGIGEAF